MRTNEDKLVRMAVIGEISPPKLGRGYRPDNAGQAAIPIGMAGIVYNVRVGDPQANIARILEIGTYRQEHEDND